MYPCGWLGAFALASWVAWAAGQEDSATRTSTAKNITTKLVSAELHPNPNAEGNLETRCVVSTFPDVTRQPRVVANTTLTENVSPRTCPPSETPTQVYDPDSLFGAPPPPPPDGSFILERAKNYFVAYNRERRFSKAQVLGMVLVAMMAEHEGSDDGINVLKSQIQLGEQEEPPIVVVCLPDGFREERVLKGCIEGETGAGVASSNHPFQGDTQQNEKREVKTVIDLLKGTATKSPDKAAQTYLPPRQAPPVTAPEAPAAANPPTASHEPLPGTKSEPQMPGPRQTAPVVQLSLSGIIRAVLPLSISKMTAELSLSLAPVAQTAFAVPSTAKPKPSSPKPPLRLSPKTTNPSSTPDTTPTTADSSSPQTSADFTPVHQPQTPSAVVLAATSSPVTHSVPVKNISSPPSPPPIPLMESTPTTGSAGSPTESSEFSTQPNTTPPSSELSDTATLSFWVTSD